MAAELEGLHALAPCWRDLPQASKLALMGADPLVQRVALETAAAVATTLRAPDLHGRPIAAKRAEKEVLETAAKELKLLVLHTGGSPHALDGQIPLSVQSGCGLIGIEVKSGHTTVPTDEVEKFRNDLNTTSYALGILVSTRARIAKIPPGLHVDHEPTCFGRVPVIFVSPVTQESMMAQLTRNALALSLALAKSRNTSGVSPNCGLRVAQRSPDDWMPDLEAVSRSISCEVEAIGLVRLRLREDEECTRRRVVRANDALLAIQHRLADFATSAGAGTRDPDDAALDAMHFV